MALTTEAGTFALNTGTGNQTVTLANAALTPKAVILWTTKQTADGITTDACLTIGYATGATDDASFGSTSQDGQASSVADSSNWANAVLNAPAVNQGAGEVVTLVSFAAGEFVVNVGTAGAAILVHYLALGGDDLTNAKAMHFQAQAGTGTQAVTGVGFQPDCAIFLGNFDNSPSRSRTIAFGTLGFATASDQAVVGWSANDNVATMDTRRTERSGFCVAIPSQAADSYLHLGALSSFDADGFTINWTTASARFLGVLLLKGGQYEVGVETQKTSTAGTKATTTTFQPTGLLLASFNAAATTSVVAHARVSIGAASSATARAASWMGDTDAAADSECDRSTQQDQCLILADSGSPAAFAAAADLSSFNATDFTLDWDDGAGGNPDATAREFIWLAFGEAGGGGGGLSIPVAMHNYRRRRVA